MFAALRPLFFRGPARQDKGLKCLDCRNLDRPLGADDFWCSNLRRCRADGRRHWIGQDAENCVDFEFKE